MFRYSLELCLFYLLVFVRGRRRNLLSSSNGANSLKCNNFENLSDLEQFLCINGTVDIWSIPNNITEYVCFSEHEIETALSSLGLTNDQYNYLREIGNNVNLVLDVWSLAGNAAFILLNEVFGFNATMMDWYEDSMDIVSYFQPPHAILEVYNSDMGNVETNDFVLAGLSGLSSVEFWALQKEVEQELYDEFMFDNDTCNDDIFLNWWESYTLDDVIDVLWNDGTTDFNDIPRGDGFRWDGYVIPCPSNHSCVNSTWYPDVCANNTSKCATLFHWLSASDDYADRGVIESNNMRMKVTYIGGEWNGDTQQFIYSHLQNKSRVLWNTWSPTIYTATDFFSPIAVDGLLEGEQAFKLIPKKLATHSSFAFDVLVSLLVTNDDYDWILKRVWNIENVFETYYTRLDQTCQWLKSSSNNNSNNANSWLSWVPGDISLYMYSCDDYSDSSLQDLTNGENSDFTEFIDESIAMRILDDCVEEGDSYPAIVLAVQVLCAIAVIVHTMYIYGVFFFRNTAQIMRTSSWKIIMISLFGGYFGIMFVFLFDASSYIVCFLRPIFAQSALILFLAPLTGKTWRLHKISKSMNIGFIVDSRLALRIFAFYFFIIVTCAIVEILFPAQRQTVIYSHEEFDIYMPSDVFKTFEIVLYLCEFVMFCYSGLLAWKLRNANKKYNESKHIAIILYNSILFVSLIILFAQMNMSPYYEFATKALLWMMVVEINTAVLLVPKFYHIRRGTEFMETGLGKTNSTEAILTIDTRSPSRNDIRKMKKLLKTLGYEVTNVSAEMGSVGSDSSTNHATTTVSSMETTENTDGQKTKETNKEENDFCCIQ